MKKNTRNTLGWEISNKGPSPSTIIVYSIAHYCSLPFFLSLICQFTFICKKRRLSSTGKGSSKITKLIMANIKTGLSFWLLLFRGTVNVFRRLSSIPSFADFSFMLLLFSNFLFKFHFIIKAAYRIPAYQNRKYKFSSQVNTINKDLLRLLT